MVVLVEKVRADGPVYLKWLADIYLRLFHGGACVVKWCVPLLCGLHWSERNTAHSLYFVMLPIC